MISATDGLQYLHGWDLLTAAESDKSNKKSSFSSEEKQFFLAYIKSNFKLISEREMARNLNIGKTTVNRFREELGLLIDKNTVNENFFEKWSHDSSYILGFIFADGNISYLPAKSYRALTITASETDKDHLEKIRNLMQSTKELIYSSKTHSYRLIINNEKICRDLINIGAIPRKSLIVNFPKISGEFLADFLRGIIDGDGHIRYVDRKRSPYFEITVCSGSKKFLEKMSRVISGKIGVFAKMRKVGNNTYLLQYSCKRGLELAKWIYRNPNLCLERKYSEYKKALNGGDKR